VRQRLLGKASGNQQRMMDDLARRFVVDLIGGESPSERAA
jgi:hypothetical protein